MHDACEDSIALSICAQPQADDEADNKDCCVLYTVKTPSVCAAGILML